MKKADQMKKNQRRQAKQTRRLEADARRRQERQRQRLYIAGGAVVVAAVIAVWVWSATRPKLGVAVPVLSRDHIASVTTPHEPYNSNPPTSGQHVPNAAPWGFYTEEIPDEVVIHNLEHGGIWISYKDPKDQPTIDALRTLMPKLPHKTIVTLRRKDDSRIAVASWGRLMKLDRVDAALIVEFANQFRNKAPEPFAE